MDLRALAVCAPLFLLTHGLAVMQAQSWTCTSICNVVLVVVSRLVAKQARRREPVGASPQASSSRCSPLPAPALV